MTNYAYLDKQGILRIVENKERAKEYAKINGKVVETALLCEGGVPTMFNKGTRKQDMLWVFGVGEAYFEPRQRQGEELRVKRYPELLDIFLLYRELEDNVPIKQEETTKISTIIE